MASAAGLILAAGAGTRFGETPKQLAELGGRPLLQWAIDAQCDVDPGLLDPVVLVLGARAGEVRDRVDTRRCVVVDCGDWAAGQSASLRCGLSALASSGSASVLVTLGDEPLITPGLVARFAAEPPPARAVHGGRPGHPVLLGPVEIAQARSVRGDQGARGLLRHARAIEIGHLVTGGDVDTPADLETVRRARR